MGVYITPFVNVVVDTDIMASGDSLGAKNSFNVPEHGMIMSVVALDAEKQSANFDIVFFQADIGTYATNAVFSPSDAELLTSMGSVLVDTWKAYEDNSQGVVDNVGLPYWAPGGVLYFQCVTRGTPTYVATSDIQIRLGIVT